MSSTPRLASLDQFRGYTVAGMCLVNFLAPFAAIHSVLKHNNTYLSYADTIMPGFVFVVGFAFRLTYLKRRGDGGTFRTNGSYVRRSGKLLLLSLLIYVFIGDLPRWFEFRDMPPEFARGTTGQRAAAIGEPISESSRRAPSASPMTTNPSFATIDPATVSAAIERLRSWRRLGWANQLLVHWRILAARLIKSELWETLAIIGATQLVVLPAIGWRFSMRIIAMVALGATHCLLAYWFNWDFVYGVPGNWMSTAWMTGGDRGWDGGAFGPLNWAIAMLGGTLAYDLVAGSASRAAAIAKLAIWGLAFLSLGYSMSCLTRLYDLTGPELAALRERHLRQDAEKAWLDHAIADKRADLNGLKASGDPRDQVEHLEGVILVLDDLRRGYPDLTLAESPVAPPWERLHGRSLGDLIAEPPFVAPPADDPRIEPFPCLEYRLQNYWMLGKRMPNLSFVTFATGFEFALFAVFVAACDIGGLQLGLFRTLGTNPLAAYFIHGMVALILAFSVPHDVPLGICLSGFAIAFTITYLLVRVLEKRGLYWRL